MKDFLKNNGILILIIAILISLITAVLSVTFGGIANPFANLAGIIATPFRNGFQAITEWGEGIYADAFERQAMEEELAELKKENAALKDQAREGQAASRENEQLRELLGLREERPEFEWVDAKVTAHGSSNWNSTLTIAKGSASGIEAGDCVIDQYGYLVGVIDNVGLNWASLITVTDVDFQMGGRIARTDSSAIIEGDFSLMSQGKLKMTYLPENAQLLSGDTIVTSGLVSGGEATYPSDLVVGYVEQVRTDETGMSDYAILTPATELSSLELVFVITDF